MMINVAALCRTTHTVTLRSGKGEIPPDCDISGRLHFNVYPESSLGLPFFSPLLLPPWVYVLFFLLTTIHPQTWPLVCNGAKADAENVTFAKHSQSLDPSHSGLLTSGNTCRPDLCVPSVGAAPSQGLLTGERWGSPEGFYNRASECEHKPLTATSTSRGVGRGASRMQHGALWCPQEEICPWMKWREVVHLYLQMDIFNASSRKRLRKIIHLFLRANVHFFFSS